MVPGTTLATSRRSKGEPPEALNGKGFEVANRVHASVGNLDLDLVADAGLGVRPVVRHHEAAGRGGSDDGAGDFLGRDIGQARAFAVDLDAKRGVVLSLGVLQISQPRNLDQLGPDFLGMLAGLGEVRACQGDFHWG